MTILQRKIWKGAILEMKELDNTNSEPEKGNSEKEEPEKGQF